MPVDLTQISKSLSDSTGNVSITKNKHLSAAIDLLFGTSVPADEVIRIQPANGPTSTGPQTIKVTGAGVGGTFDGMQIELVISVRTDGGQDQAHLLLTATSSASWIFADRFPSLKESAAMTELQADANSKLILSSFTEAGTANAGLTFEGDVQYGSLIDDLLQALTGRASSSVSGMIGVDQEIVTLNLRPTSTTGSRSLGFLQLSNVSVGVAVAPFFDVIDEKMVSRASFILNAQIDFLTAGRTHSIPLSTTVTNGLGGAIFRADLNDVIEAGLDELQSLVNKQDLSFLKTSQPGLQLSDVLRLQELSFRLGPSFSLDWVQFGVESAHPWVLCQNEQANTSLSLEKVSVTVTLFLRGGSNIMVTLGGSLRVGQALLNVSGSYQPGLVGDELEVTASLGGQGGVKLSDVIRLFTAYDTDQLPDLAVTTFNVRVIPGVQYAGSICVDGEIDIPGLDTAITEVAFGVDFVSGQSFSAWIEGRIEIAGFLFDLEAEHPAGGKGWTFSGEGVDTLDLKLTDAVGDLLTFFQIQAPALTLPDIHVTALRMQYTPASRDFVFECRGDLMLDGASVTASVLVGLSHNDGAYHHSFAGQLEIDNDDLKLVFDLIFDDEGGSKTYLATYQDAAGGEIELGALIRAISNNKVFDDIGDAFTFTIKDALICCQDGGTAKYLVTLNLGVGIDLSELGQLPIVDAAFPPGKTLRIALAPVLATQDFARQEIEDLRALAANDSSGLPAAKAGEDPLHAVKQGVGMSITLDLGDDKIDLDLPLAVNKDSGAVEEQAPPSGGPAQPDGFRWVKLQKSFGPLHVERVGVKYDRGTGGAKGTLSFGLDAGLSTGGLSVSLDGLQASYSLDRFEPQFALRGMGIDFSKGELEIGGAFLNLGNNQFAGAAQIRYKQLAISAIGAYSEIDGHASLFIYAVLDYPIGGPSFFFVTGLAFGFGYNRSLIPPPIASVEHFPLIVQAVNPQPAHVASSQDIADRITSELTTLQDAIPPNVGQYFLAVGIKFTSFKLIESFALLVIQFGREFEIDLLGISRAIIPTPEAGGPTSLAEVELVFKAVFLPEEGFLGVEAQLTPSSFLLSRDCRLQGGFAFYCWFKDQVSPTGLITAGDFVLTVGGYHPNFTPPKHYPVPPRLAFQWQVDEHLQFKGSAYFALTPHALMAGGGLEATWQDGSLSAQFLVGADFLISWKPYHYEAHIYLTIGVTYTFSFFGTHTISVNVGADLNIFGPPFSGTAYVHLWIVSFSVDFGSAGAAIPQPISWDAFRASFLPADMKLCAITVRDGVVARGSGDVEDLGVLNAERISVLIDCAIPITVFTGGGGLNNAGGLTTSYGVAPVAVAKSNFSSQVSVSITSGVHDFTAKFDIEPVSKNLPVALWGESLSPNLNEPNQFIRNGLTGCTLSAQTGLTPPGEASMAAKASAFDTSLLPQFQWQAPPGSTLTRPADSRAQVRSTLRAPSAADRRRDILLSFGFLAPGPQVTVDTSIALELFASPLIEEMGGTN